MKGIFVRETRRGVPYAYAITAGIKTIETRSRNMLRQLVGERVEIIRTGKGPATIVGRATITGAFFCPLDQFDALRDQHLIPPGSCFDATGRGKWCYEMADAETCEPYPLPASALRHGMSWAEWN